VYIWNNFKAVEVESAIAVIVPRTLDFECLKIWARWPKYLSGDTEILKSTNARPVFCLYSRDIQKSAGSPLSFEFRLQKYLNRV
jgi:hypothetical protein